MDSTFVILIFAILLIAFISIINTTFALQYSNYTSDKLLVQFQYPLTWGIVEKNASFDEGPSIEITDPLLGLGYIYLAFTNLSDYEAKNSSDTYLNIRDLKQFILQSFKNNTSTIHYLIEYPSYLTIDGRKAATFTYVAKDRFEDHSVTKTKAWVVLARDGFYVLGFGTDTNITLFDSPEYTEMRDRFLNSVKFLEADQSPTINPIYEYGDQSIELAQEAKMMGAQGYYTKAIQLLDQALALDPNYLYALSLKGSMFVMSGNEEEGIVWADKALDLDPNNFNALLVKGIALTSLGKYDFANVYLDKALAIRGNDTLLLINKGLSLSNLGKYTEAIPYYDKILSGNPNDPLYVNALYFKGITFAKMGKQDTAIVQYDEALALRPDYADVMWSKTWALFSEPRILEGFDTMIKSFAVKVKIAIEHSLS